jgi:hypothetical protein
MTCQHLLPLWSTVSTSCQLLQGRACHQRPLLSMKSLLWLTAAPLHHFEPPAYQWQGCPWQPHKWILCCRWLSYRDVIIQGGWASSTLIVKCHFCPVAWRIGFQSYHSHARTAAADKAVDGGWQLAIVAISLLINLRGSTTRKERAVFRWTKVTVQR